ncbi:MAG: pantoate--beta-alanine ligase [Planctomycetota bacterium]
MLQFEATAPATDWCRDCQRSGETVGLVPTMGALHEGHLSLVRLAKQKCDRVAVTIFVNPTQFAPDEDLARYPRTIDKDLSRLQQLGVDAVFMPETSTMYPDGFGSFVEPGPIAKKLEGEARPEHFRGVTTIVTKLFHVLPADVAVFGQKDYQQWKVIEAMVRDLHFSIELVAAAIVRETDGLAMSSRNAYLSHSERHRALSLYRTLQETKQRVRSGIQETSTLQKLMRSDLSNCDAVDYAVIVDRDSLQPITLVNQPAVVLIAARVGRTRLIDNLVLLPADSAS